MFNCPNCNKIVKRPNVKIGVYMIVCECKTALIYEQSIRLMTRNDYNTSDSAARLVFEMRNAVIQHG